MKISIFITIETEGSAFVETDYPINLISLSPKFSNSVPVVGVETPQGGITDERMVKQHNKLRLNYDAIKQLNSYHAITTLNQYGMVKIKEH